MFTKSIRRITKLVLIWLNIGIALCFLLGSYGSVFNPLQYWFTGFFALGSFYLFILLIGFFLFWLFIKPPFVLISFITILLAWGPLKHLVKIRLSEDFKVEKQPAAIRAMSWNVEHFDILEHRSHPEKKQEMLEMINKYQPDIACFQEMVGSDSVSSAINYIPAFLSRLTMNGYHFSYNRKLDFDGKHHFGIITFSKYPIIHKRTISFPPNDYNSIFQFSDIVKDKDTFRVFNVHLQSLKFSDDNLKYIDDPSIKDESDLKKSKNIISKFKTGFLKRHIQSDRIKQEIEKSPYPVIVCGDFNDVPNSYAYNRIGKGMQNAFAEKGNGIGRTFYGISPTLRIDNIFAGTRFNITQYVRIKKKLSDHFPIIADLYLKNK